MAKRRYSTIDICIWTLISNLIVVCTCSSHGTIPISSLTLFFFFFKLLNPVFLIIKRHNALVFMFGGVGGRLQLVLWYTEEWDLLQLLLEFFGFDGNIILNIAASLSYTGDYIVNATIWFEIFQNKPACCSFKGNQPQIKVRENRSSNQLLKHIWM